MEVVPEMAGDWIKMRGNLWDDPRVGALVDATDTCEATIVGGLYWLWATADQHTEDGLMPGLSVRQIDRKTNIQGFGQALVDVGWLSEENGGVRLARFTEHNGASAKTRATDAQRKARVRTLSGIQPDISRTDDGQNSPKSGAREEKRREEKREIQEEPAQARAGVIPRPKDVTDQTWTDWKQLRKAKRATVSATVLDGARKEADKAGLSLEEFLAVWVQRGSQGLMADWLKPNERAGGNLNRQEALEQRNQRVVDDWTQFAE